MYELEKRMIKYPSKRHIEVPPLKVVQGHFATSNSHINCYIDVTTMKHRASEAKEVAIALATQYAYSTIVDTIVCLDGTEVVGAFMAEALTESGYVSMNEHQTIYIAVPELVSGNQLIFRDNTEMMLKGKNVIILAASVSTGISITRGIECIEYYGAKCVGVSSIFSATEYTSDGVKIHSIFTKEDIDNYETYDPQDCPLCKQGKKIEALVNSYGFSRI